MKIKLLITLIFATLTYVSSAAEVIEQYDLRSYHPDDSGLRDLVFEARIENLTEHLNSLQSYGEIQDLHFKVYWMYPGEYRIEVVEPKPKEAFKELKISLKEAIKPYLDFIIPVRLEKGLRSYSLEQVTEGNHIKLTAKDKTNMSAVREIKMFFSKEGKLQNIQNRITGGEVVTTFALDKKSWSNGKWVVDNILTRTQVGRTTAFESKSMNYQKYSTFGFPKSIEIERYQEVEYLDKDKKLQMKKTPKVTSKVLLTKYEVNKGKAKRFITKGLRK